MHVFLKMITVDSNYVRIKGSTCKYITYKPWAVDSIMNL